jgi:hypothetical protein
MAAYINTNVLSNCNSNLFQNHLSKGFVKLVPGERMNQCAISGADPGIL